MNKKPPWPLFFLNLSMFLYFQEFEGKGPLWPPQMWRSCASSLRSSGERVCIAVSVVFDAVVVPIVVIIAGVVVGVYELLCVQE